MRSIQQIIEGESVAELVEYIDRYLGFEVTPVQATEMLKLASQVGGDKDPWSSGTWNMWLKNRVLSNQAQPDSYTFAAYEPEPDKTLFDIANGGILVSNGVEFRGIGNTELLNDFLMDNETWEKWFPEGANLTDQLEDRFNEQGGDEFLAGAPFSSWLFARLYTLGMCPDVEHDSGSFWDDLLTFSNNRPMSHVHFEGEGDKAAIYVEAAYPATLERVQDAVEHLLLENIRQLQTCELEVNAAELRCINRYGWNGVHFLGHDNESF